MKDKQWEAIHEVFTKMQFLCSRLPGETSYSFATEQVSEEIVKVRADVRVQLDFLRVQLAETLSEREAYLVLFPIVIYFDELVQYKYLPAGQTWPPLQKELYQIDNGGVLFYETLDDILRKPQTLPLVYEVFYFCMSHGFRGRYNDDPVKILEYKTKLLDKISTKDVEPSLEYSTAPVSAGSIKNAWFYYAGSVGVILVAYFLINLIAGYAKPI
jgi:type IV/VI secretion system ImpK/VasF family protein